MRPPAPTQPTASKETIPEQNGTLSQLISHLKSSFRPTDFESVTQLLTARDKATRKEIFHWKARYEAMEKKQGQTALEKIMTEDELHKLKRERDLLKDQVARAETDKRVLIDRMEENSNVRVARFREDQKQSEERERKWKEMYDKVWEDFEKVETEKTRLECRVSALEFEKEVLMSAGFEERRGEEMGPETSNDILNELVMDGNEGGSNGGEKADSVPCGGGSAPSEEDQENGIVLSNIYVHFGFV